MALILGIDPGSRVTGYGLIRQLGARHEYVDSGCIRAGDEGWAERLNRIFEGVSALVDEYAPGEVAIEQVFMARNADSALKLGQARGVAIVAAAQKGLAVAEYSARQIKQSVVGRGGADKAQIQHMVCHLLALSRAPGQDAADALAVALCHSHTQQGLVKLAGASGYKRKRFR